MTSVADGRGVDRLRALVSRGVTAVTGQSGVGKSSLLNVVQPGLNLRVREVSDWTFKGKHTTTTAELIELEAGGFVVDTPGLRQFELWGVVPGELEAYFVEFRPFIPHCRFPDCSHTHENRLRRQGGRLLGPDPPWAISRAIASSTINSRCPGIERRPVGPNSLQVGQAPSRQGSFGPESPS